MLLPILVLVLAGASTVSSPADTLSAHVIAGSGALGMEDGPALSASFLMPTQIAIDKTGVRLYVVDTAAQRIRLIDKDGNVSTVAGSGAVNASGNWVDGGFADGPALQAKFNRPDGIAVSPDGRVFIADRENFVVRVLAHGVIGTFAGAPHEAGMADGARAAGHLNSPRALAMDPDGSLYVADWRAGIRKISPDGTIATMQFKGATIDRATGVAYAVSGPYKALMIADALGLVRVTLPSLTAERIPSFPSGTEPDPPIVSDQPLGVPYAVAPFNVGEVVYTDLRDSSVKYFRITSYLRYLGAIPLEDAMVTGGGSSSAEQAPKYEAPMGLAIDASGAVYVADAGNRRIVRLEPFERKAFLTGADFDKIQFEPHRYRVAVVGPSYTWWNSTASNSVAGLLGAKLNGVTALAATPASMRYFQQTTATGQFDLIDSVLSAGNVDLVVLFVPATKMLLPDLHARIQRNAVAMRASSNGKLLVVLTPTPQSFSPSEAPYLFNERQADESSDYVSEHERLAAALAGIDVPVLDLYPVFQAELAKKNHHPLFSTGDIHYTPFARELVADAIFRKWAQVQHWSLP